MTEKRGGSDVARTTETVAIAEKEGKYRLYGYKFFCSNSDCDVTLALARIIEAEKSYTPEVLNWGNGLFL
jgi:alkylation response protein AidB-like acyl-CoA dehydrogenase